MANVDEVKGGLALREAKAKLLECLFAGDAARLAHGRGEARQVGADFNNNLDLGGQVAALAGDSRAKGMRSPFTSLDTIINV